MQNKILQMSILKQLIPQGTVDKNPGPISFIGL